jgi:hypothetical protein
MLERLLQLGFCNNQEHGFPSMEEIRQAFMNAIHVDNITAGLNMARPDLGDQVGLHVPTYQVLISTCGELILIVWVFLIP